MKKISLSLLLFAVVSVSKSQLIINELSQGDSGGREYVELLVTGTPTCGGSNTIDIRGWIIDDNNSWHATGSGTGIAAGHVRFDSIPQWQNVKIGSLILIYNDADIGAAVSALTIDTNDSNNDCVYVIPVSSSVLEKNVTLPTSNGTMATYATAGNTYTNIGNWIVLGMANTNDAFHTVSPADYSTTYHAIGWGNNTSMVDVYFNRAQTGSVIYMGNLVNNDPYNQANYVDTTAITHETPGAPNNAANADWIASFNNHCQPFVPFAVTTNNPSPITCNPGYTVVTANAVGGASYVWSTGHYGASDTITNAGTYTVTVSDAGDVCSASASVTVTSNPDLEISVSGTNDFCESGNGTATVTVTNGTANSFTWSTGSSGTTIGNLSEGVYYVTASDGTCATVDSVTIAAAGSITISTSSVNTSCGRNNGTASVTITSGTVNTITWNTGSSSTSLQNLSAGSYSVTVTDNMGCSATATVSVQSSSSTPVSISSSNLQICPSDSTQICAATGFTTYLWNTGETSRCIWAKNAGNYYITATDANNCTTESNRLSLSVFPQEPIGITVNGNVMTAFYGTNYQWFLNNTLIPGASSSVYTATQTGSYTLQAVDSNGCVGYSTPVNITVTGIENLETLHFSVYPNPSHLGNFILQLGDIREPVVVCLFDVTGKLVEEVQTKTNRVSFGENILAGVYILRLTISEKTFTQKLIKL